MTADLDVRCAHVLPRDPAFRPRCAICGVDVEAEDSERLDALAEAEACEAELEAVRSDPFGRNEYGCCGFRCPCHVRGYKGESPCVGCVEVLDGDVVAARQRFERLGGAR